MIQQKLSAPSNIFSGATHYLICTLHRSGGAYTRCHASHHGNLTSCGISSTKRHSAADFLIMVWSAHVYVEQASHHAASWKKALHVHALSSPQERRGRLACSSVRNMSLASCKVVLSALLRLIREGGNRRLCILWCDAQLCFWQRVLPIPARPAAFRWDVMLQSSYNAGELHLR